MDWTQDEDRRMAEFRGEGFYDRHDMLNEMDNDEVNERREDEPRYIGRYVGGELIAHARKADPLVVACATCSKRLSPRWTGQEPYHYTCSCYSTDLDYCEEHAPEPGTRPRLVCCDSPASEDTSWCPF